MEDLLIDPFGIDKTPAFYGPGITVCYYVILLAFYIDIFTWSYKNWSDLSKHISPAFGKGSNGSPGDIRPSAPPKHARFGFNLKLFILLLYHGIVSVDMITRLVRHQKSDLTNFGSLITATAYYEATVGHTLFMLLWVLSGLSAARKVKPHFHDREAIYKEYYIGLICTAVIVLCRIWTIFGIPGDEIPFPISTIDQHGYKEIISRTLAELFWEAQMGEVRIDKRAVGSIVRTVSIRIVNDAHFIKYCTTTTLAWAIGAHTWIRAIVISPLFSFTTSLFNKDERFWMDRALIDQKSTSWRPMYYRWRLLFLVVYLFMLLTTFATAIGGTIFSISTSIVILYSNFKYVAEAPGHLVNLDEAATLPVGIWSLSYSCYCAVYSHSKVETISTKDTRDALYKEVTKEKLG